MPTTWSIPQDSLTGLFTIDAQCDDGTVFFDLGVDFGITEYFWDFGVPSLTDDTANIPNPSFFYSDTGTFIVTVIGTSGDGCADTATELYRCIPFFGLDIFWWIHALIFPLYLQILPLQQQVLSIHGVGILAIP